VLAGWAGVVVVMVYWACCDMGPGRVRLDGYGEIGLLTARG
jgi:hypothetical protein